MESTNVIFNTGGNSDRPDETSLIERINSEREKILLLINNPIIGNWETGKAIFEKYVLADRALLEKLQQPECYDPVLSEITTPLLQVLQKELEALEHDLQRVVEKSMLRKEELERREKRIQELNEMRADDTPEQEPINQTNISKVEENLKKRFLHEKSHLKAVLAAVLPDDVEMKEMIAKLVENGINEPETYVKMADVDGMAERIALLVKTTIFEIHPLDPLQVRLVDLS